jgi:hypothetical protein
LDTLTEFAMGRRLQVGSYRLFFLQVAAWSSVEHRSTDAARRSVASSPLDFFLLIQSDYTVERFRSLQLTSAA